MKSPLKSKLLARVAWEHNLATKHYKMAFKGYVTGEGTGQQREASGDPALAEGQGFGIPPHPRRAL